MTDEEKLYTLMAQAEDLQTHAAKLQNEAKETFSALPIAVEQAGKKIRSTCLQMALLLLGLAIVVCGGSVGFFVWSTESLREERKQLDVEVRAAQASLEKMQANTWGLTFQESEKGRFIVLPEGMTSETNWTVGKRDAIRLVK
jgi:hypothetical protein